MPKKENDIEDPLGIKKDTFGILAILFTFILFPLGLIFGIISLVKKEKSPILGILSIILSSIIIFIIIFAII